MPASTQLPSRPAAAPDKLVTAKELVELFHQQGAPISYRYALALLAQCPYTIHVRYVRFSEAWAWWLQTPAFRPFSERETKPARSRAPISRTSSKPARKPAALCRPIST